MSMRFATAESGAQSQPLIMRPLHIPTTPAGPLTPRASSSSDIDPSALLTDSSPFFKSSLKPYSSRKSSLITTQPLTPSQTLLQAGPLLRTPNLFCFLLIWLLIICSLFTCLTWNDRIFKSCKNPYCSCIFQLLRFKEEGPYSPKQQFTSASVIRPTF